MKTIYIVCDKEQSIGCKELKFSYELYRDWCHSLSGTCADTAAPLRVNPISRKAYNKL